MQHASTARAFLRRLHPWLGRAVHVRWSRSRSQYRHEAEELLMLLTRHEGRLPPDLALRIEGFVGKLYREWFPRSWRPTPTYAEVVADFRWWFGVAEEWGRAGEKPTKPRAASRRPPRPLAKQPEKLLRLLRLPLKCPQEDFLVAWRKFVKTHHPDWNPGQSAEERRRFAEAVALKRR